MQSILVQYAAKLNLLINWNTKQSESGVKEPEASDLAVGIENQGIVRDMWD